MAYNMKGFSGFGNSPVKQKTNNKTVTQLESMRDRWGEIQKKIKYRLRKSKVLHPPTQFEKMQDYNDARIVERKGWGDEKFYQKYKKKTEQRRPNIRKHWIEGNE